LQYFNYTEQINGYCYAVGAKLGMIIAYSRKTKKIETILINTAGTEFVYVAEPYTLEPNNWYHTAVVRSGSAYNITSIIGTIPTPGNYTTTTQLGFGEESILLGNINTDIKATVYKTKFSQTLGFNQYNSSNNPTWTDDDDVYVTEAAIYDQNNSLVAVGKLNNPIKKNTNKLFTVELDMDF
jgi:hypothetical protein